MIFEVPDWAGYLRFREQIEGVLDPLFHTLEWLDAQVLSGAFRVFAGERAIILTRIKIYPTFARELQGLAAAGDLEEIETVLIPEAEKYGRLAGCIRARIESRDGWERVMKKHGYTRFQTAIVKGL